MEKPKYKLRCRNKGILVTLNPENYDVVWKRIFNPEIYPEDAKNKIEEEIEKLNNEK